MRIEIVVDVKTTLGENPVWEVGQKIGSTAHCKRLVQ